MNLFVVSHPCVTPVNQGLFESLERRTGWRITLAVPRVWRTEYGLHRAQRWPGFSGQILPLPAWPIGNIPLHIYLARLSEILNEASPDLIYVHHEPYALATAQLFWANSRGPRVPIGFYAAQNISKRYPPPVGWTERRVLASAAFALPVTNDALDVLRSHGYAGSALVFPLGIDSRILYPTEHRAATNDFTIGFVGRLSREKGLHILLQAMARMSAHRPRLVVAGAGPESESLKAQAESLALGERVEWLGYVPHDRVVDIYRRLDLLAIPSLTVLGRREQFGRVVVEALACGVPVVTSDTGELPALVAATGGGWVTPEGDEMALASLLDMLQGDRTAIRERAARGRAKTLESYENNVLADRLAVFLTGVLEH